MEAETVLLIDKDFKATVLNVFKELKGATKSYWNPGEQCTNK